MTRRGEKRVSSTPAQSAVEGWTDLSPSAESWGLVARCSKVALVRETHTHTHTHTQRQGERETHTETG